MDNVLATLLGSAAKAKLLRLFLTNPDAQWTLDEIRSATRLQTVSINRELKTLMKMSLIKSGDCKRQVQVKKGKVKKEINKKFKCFFVDKKFKFLSAIRQLLLNIDPAEDTEIIKGLKKVGAIKLLILSGVFLHEDDARVDLLIVADKIKEKALKNEIAKLESHIGKEISYLDLSPAEFSYRLGMYDRLLRDILDAPYKILIDKFKNSWQDLSMAKI